MVAVAMKWDAAESAVVVRALQVVGLVGLRENFKPNRPGQVEKVQNRNQPL